MKAPNWAVNCLGRKVKLIKSFDDAVRHYPAGSVGRLVSIQAGKRSPYATVSLDGDTECGEENFKFSQLKPL